MTAPLPPEMRSLRALALHMLRSVCGAKGAEGPAVSETSLLAGIRGTPAESDAKLCALADRFGLSDGELLAAALVLAVETDAGTARLIAQAQNPVGNAHPLAGFLATIFAAFGLDCVTLASGPAARIGLLALGDEPAPLAERSIGMPLALVAALGGGRLEPDGIHPLRIGRTALPEALVAEPALLVLRSPSLRESEAIAALIGETLALAPVVLGEQQHVAQHVCWLAASASLPVLRRSLGPGERCRIEDFGAWDGPLLLLAGMEGVIEAPLPSTEWALPLPDRTERVALWQAGGVEATLAEQAAVTYRQGAGRIAEVAERIALLGGDALSWADLVAAADAGASQLDSLARRSSARVAREDLVVPPELGEALELLIDRIRLRDQLSEGLGSSLRARYRPGVRALFTGESGTGKTLAVHWIARRVGLPLYRVDLAAMTSKWIGETEKNLSSVLDAAQHADVVLFFDEADSLFGARTDVGDSHDRFANAQTNYLLQRIEDFDGVAVLATNSRDRFDPAFVRRLDAILEFPLPSASARRALWETHLGNLHGVTAEELDLLSVTIDLAGGHIRNVVLGAATRARRAGRPLAAADLARAAEEEYGKLGRSAPPLPW
nr:ATP-binding protein [uncultured Sphingomonas sp.]